MNQRAYSVLEVKSIDEDAREVTGWATTPSPDRMQDVVEPKGATYKLPIPFLLHHDSRQPVGHVISAKVTDKGIEIKAKLAKIEDPGPLKDRVDEAWQSIKAGLIRGLSIGFRGLETAQIKDTWGVRFIRWEWMELSAVTIAANAEASIETIKSIDERLLAASGNKPSSADGSDPPPRATGTKPTASGGFFSSKAKGSKVNIQEQIASFDAKRTAANAAREAIMTKSAESGETLDDEQSAEYDALGLEIKKVDAHLVRLREHEKTVVAKAVRVEPDAGTDPTKGTEIRNGVISIKSNVLPGTDFVRYAMAMMQSKGNIPQALHLANQRWKDSSRVIASIKAAMDAGTTADTTWAAPLVEYQTMASEFIELLRPMTIIGRIPGGLRRVPFNVRMQRQTSGVTGAFVGEGLAKPVNELAFDAITLGFHKVAVIVVMTMELMKFSDPNAEAVVRQDMLDGIATFLDKRFIDPQYSATAVSPASITNGITPIVSTGSTISAITNDVESLLGAFTTANLNFGRAVWIMSPTTALSIQMKRNNQDQFAFPGITANGGTFMGLPVVTSNSAVAAGSPSEQLIVLLDPSEILYADDGGLTIDMSNEASLQMNDAPSAGAQSLVSLWQQNLSALRAEKMCTWARRRTQAVQVLGNANW